MAAQKSSFNSLATYYEFESSGVFWNIRFFNVRLIAVFS